MTTSMPPLRLLSLAFASALLCSIAFAQEPAPTTRIVDRVDENSLVTLAGNTHPLARAKFDRGKVSPDLAMDLVLVLKRGADQQQAFDKFVASQSDPASPNFHHWLEPEEVGERFGPSESDIAVIRNWLTSRGLTVGDLSKDRMTLRFSGTAEQVSSAFHTEIHKLDVKGEQHFANMSDPRIPAALAPVVAGPKALHNFIPHPLHRLGNQVRLDKETGRWQRIESDAKANSRTGATPLRPEFGVNDPNAGVIEDVTPFDFAAMYNVTSAWNKGFDGTGQTIAIVGTSEINPADLASFRSQFGLPVIKSFSQVIANGFNPGQCGLLPTNFCGMGDQVENSLDVEWSSAVAKGASIVLVVSGENPAGSIDTVFDSADYIVQHKTAPVVNVSYGLCELGEGTAGNLTYKNLWQSASAEGIAVFVASGDAGAATCDQGQDQGGQNVPYAAEYGLSVSGIASTPYNTAVGGTDLVWCDQVKTSDGCSSEAAKYWNTANAGNKGNARGYVPEIPWNSTCISNVGIEAAGYWDNQLFNAGFSGLPNTPQDSEQSCNFYVNWASTISQAGGPDLSFLVDTVGGGGGQSNCINGNGQSTTSCTQGYPKPSWQAGVTGISADGRRDIPDVSFFASSGFLGSAYLICVSANGSCAVSATSENVAQEIGGTSASSPAMAGVMAIINQKSGAAWGNPNAELYTLAKGESYASCSAEGVKSSSSCYFNDIDKGSNSEPCDHTSNSPDCQDLHSDAIGTLKGYNAGRGFDMASGLGSLNVGNVVNAWPEAPVPQVTLSSSTLRFASTARGSSTTQTITLKSSGKASLSLAGTGKGIAISGTNATSFSQTNTCGTSLAVGASCSIKVTFKPALVGSLTATLTIGDNAATSPQSVALSGPATGLGVGASPSQVTFAKMEVGHHSYPTIVTLTNVTTSPTKLGVLVTGTNASAFQQTNTCSGTIAPSATCKVSLVFAPTTTIGNLSAALRVSYGTSGLAAKFNLAGLSAGPIVQTSRSGLTFLSTAVNTDAPTQSFTLSNKGNLALAKPGGGPFISITGADASSFSQTNTCGVGIQAGTSCTITVEFRPRSTGTLTAAVTFTDNAAPSTQTILLTGTGQ